MLKIPCKVLSVQLTLCRNSFDDARTLIQEPHHHHLRVHAHHHATPPHARTHVSRAAALVAHGGQHTPRSSPGVAVAFPLERVSKHFCHCIIKWARPFWPFGLHFWRADYDCIDLDSRPAPVLPLSRAARVTGPMAGPMAMGTPGLSGTGRRGATRLAVAAAMQRRSDATLSVQHRGPGGSVAFIDWFMTFWRGCERKTAAFVQSQSQ